jgi:hypothetical protein
MTLWGDYVGYPGGAALAAAGIGGVIRYVGIGGSFKRLTAGELADLRAHGIEVLGVAESTSTEADNGYSAGVSDAQAVLNDPVTATLPYIFATNDKPSYVQADVDYVSGFASVLGSRAGAYGFATFLTAVRGLVPVFWQAGEPPNATGTQGWVHFWQRNGTAGNGSDGAATPTAINVNSVSVDLDNQLLALPQDQGDAVSTGCFPSSPHGSSFQVLSVPQVGTYCRAARITLASGWGNSGTVTVWAVAGPKQYLGNWTFGVGVDNPWIQALPSGTEQISIEYQSDYPLGWGVDVDK